MRRDILNKSGYKCIIYTSIQYSTIWQLIWQFIHSLLITCILYKVYFVKILLIHNKKQKHQTYQYILLYFGNLWNHLFNICMNLYEWKNCVTFIKITKFTKGRALVNKKLNRWIGQSTFLDRAMTFEKINSKIFGMKGQLNYMIQENIFKNQLIIKIKYFFIQYLIFVW